jgi:hypothetical protein
VRYQYGDNALQEDAMNTWKLPGTVLAILLFGTAGVAQAASSPTVTTGAASPIGQNSATLNGKINPNGAATKYYFQYGTSIAYGAVTSLSSLPAGSKAVAVKATIAGLLPDTTYYYRLVASNPSGESLGANRTLRTTGNPPPGASTTQAVSIGQNRGTLTGIVYPSGQTTTWFFQYGFAAPGYGYQTNPGTTSGTAPVAVSYPLYGLEAGTIFHYRLVVKHSNTPVQPGNDEWFQTYPSPRPKPRVSAGTSPRSARRTPVAFTTTGRVRGPSSIPQINACSGSVKITYRLRWRALRSVTAPVQPNCTFAAVAQFKRRPARGRVTLSITIRFQGNHYLAPASPRTEHVTLR